MPSSKKSFTFEIAFLSNISKAFLIWSSRGCHHLKDYRPPVTQITLFQLLNLFESLVFLGFSSVTEQMQTLPPKKKQVGGEKLLESSAGVFPFAQTCGILNLWHNYFVQGLWKWVNVFAGYLKRAKSLRICNALTQGPSVATSRNENLWVIFSVNSSFLSRKKKEENPCNCVPLPDLEV